MPLSRRECGRRLYAAIASCAVDALTIAEVYEFETPERVASFWEELACMLADDLRRKLNPQPSGRPKQAKPAVTKSLFVAWPKPAENTEPEF